MTGSRPRIQYQYIGSKTFHGWTGMTSVTTRRSRARCFEPNLMSVTSKITAIAAKFGQALFGLKLAGCK